MKSLTRHDHTDEQAIPSTPTMIRAQPLRKLLEALGRRRAELLEVGATRPAATLAAVRTWLMAALEAASDLDEWIPTAEAADMARTSGQTIRNRIKDSTLDKEPGPNGGYLVNRGQVLEAFGLGPIEQKPDLAA